MTYCDYEWVSDFTYKGIFDRLRIAQDPECPAYMAICPPPWEDYVAIFARVDLARIKETIELETFYHLSKTDVEPFIPSAPGKDWSIVLFDNAARRLYEQYFTPREDTDVERPGERPASIIETVPWAPGTARIVITFKGEEIASRRVSANAPRVILRSPRTGELLKQGATVQWSSTDRDGDALTYAVQYSADHGKNWKTLAAEWTKTQYSLRVDELAGSDEALFRIIASDGINTAIAESAGSVRVPKKSPRVFIISPNLRARGTVKSSISLVGEGYDAEDGSLPSESLSWTSDRDGQLGTGRQLLATLSPGSHTIQLTGRDSNANTAIAIMKLEASPPPK